EAFNAGSGGVGVNAVGAAVDRRDGDVDELLGERIEGTGLDHNLLDARPGTFEQRRLVGQGTPEIVYKVGVAGGADVVEDRLDAGDGGNVGVAPELCGGHGLPFRRGRIGRGIAVAA